MKLVKMKLVTIIAETVLEHKLVSLVQELGATGYTISAVHGEGSRGVRTSDLGGQNVKIETIVTTDVSEKILKKMSEKYFPSYALVVHLSEVEVVRGEKYIKQENSPL